MCVRLWVGGGFREAIKTQTAHTCSVFTPPEKVGSQLAPICPRDDKDGGSPPATPAIGRLRSTPENPGRTNALAPVPIPATRISRHAQRPMETGGSRLSTPNEPESPDLKSRGRYRYVQFCDLMASLSERDVGPINPPLNSAVLGQKSVRR